MQQVGCAIRVTSTECVLEIGTNPKHPLARVWYQDSWHEPIDFEKATDALVAYLRQLTIKQRVAVLKAFDSVSLDRLSSNLRMLLI
jgi:hypothetical protein